MSLRLLVTILSCLLLGVMTMVAVSAETFLSDKVFLISQIIGPDWRWGADSRVFTYEEHGNNDVDVSDAHWHSYNFEVGQFTSSTNWPLYPTHFPGEFRPLGFSASRTFAYSSASGRYVVYISRRDTSYPSLGLALADTVAGTSREMWSTVVQVTGTDYFNVLWSDNEDSFIVSGMTDNSQAWFDYIHEASTYVDEIPVESYFFMEYEGRNYWMLYPLDISSDGNRVLLLMQNDDYQRHLVMAESDASGTLQAGFILQTGYSPAAAFRPDSDSHFLILDGNGLIELDTSSGLSTMIEPASTFGKVGQAMFSPNAQWIVFSSDLMIESLNKEWYSLFGYQVP